MCAVSHFHPGLSSLLLLPIAAYCCLLLSLVYYCCLLLPIAVLLATEIQQCSALLILCNSFIVLVFSMP